MRNRALALALAAALLASAGCSSSGTQPQAPAVSERAPGSPDIRDLHLSYPGDPATAMGVLWWGAAADTVSIVEYGEAEPLAARAQGDVRVNAGASQHEVVLRGLTPDTLYYYRAGNGTDWSAISSFRTAPSGSAAFTFVAFGDSRNGLDVLGRVSAAAAAHEPAFALEVGDAVDEGGQLAQWDGFLAAVEPLAASVPLLPANGNHEAGAAGFLGQFALPGNELWYSFDYGNVHVTCLDTESSTGGEQGRWLQADLAAAAESGITWKVVMLHEPPFSSGLGHGSSLGVREAWAPLFDRYGVDLVFSGHEHNYERSGPVNYTSSPTALVDGWQDARCYVVTGGAGSPLSSVGGDWWTAARAVRFHYVKVEVSGNELRLEALTPEGVSLDRLELRKG